jgi:hypothetical protein
LAKADDAEIDAISDEMMMSFFIMVGFLGLTDIARAGISTQAKIPQRP